MLGTLVLYIWPLSLIRYEGNCPIEKNMFWSRDNYFLKLIYIIKQ